MLALMEILAPQANLVCDDKETKRVDYFALVLSMRPVPHDKGRHLCHPSVYHGIIYTTSNLLKNSAQ